MFEFVLHEHISKDAIFLQNWELSSVLLMNNSLVPWFLLVPRVEVTEFYELSEKEQKQLCMEINRLSQFLKKEFNPFKINVATLGNVVRQMHVHVVGRYEDDFCWPQAVWGRPEKKAYGDEDLAKIRHALDRF